MHQQLIPPLVAEKEQVPILQNDLSAQALPQPEHPENRPRQAVIVLQGEA